MKIKNGNVALSPTSLTPAQIEQVKAVAQASGNISYAAVLRQAIANFIDMPEDAIAPYVDRDYGKGVTFTNVYCTPETVTALDGLVEKFGKPRNQIIRGAVEKYLETQKKGEIS